jgi:hypothetical protein
MRDSGFWMIATAILRLDAGGGAGEGNVLIIAHI